MDNQDKPISPEDLKRVQEQLSQTANDPNLVLVTRSPMFCFKCQTFLEICSCSWNDKMIEFNRQSKPWTDKTSSNIVSNIVIV